jgi:cell division protein FtsB
MTDAITTKVQKALDALKAKNEKLSAEATKLKSTIAELKSANSRVRRLAKGTSKAKAPTEPVPEKNVAQPQA